jgi:hypothetical protein
MTSDSLRLKATKHVWACEVCGKTTCSLQDIRFGRFVCDNHKNLRSILRAWKRRLLAR